MNNKIRKIFGLGLLLVFLMGSVFATSSLNSIEIVAHKIVCNNESDLPNWGKHGGDQQIDSNTANDYVDSNPNCCLDSGWSFK